ncbi:MAG: GtrA family protein [Candidatus Saccharibacteria bacterium]|nr:GtrA family protein [Candidatus Saccharibacteria bacterium]
MMKKLLALYKKYEELINYLVVGVLGTAVSIFTYWLFELIAFNFFNDKNVSILLGNTISWVIVVVFLYFLNRKYVFKSKSEKVFKEFISFTLGRVFTLFLETVVIFLVVSVFSGSDLVGKVLGQIVVIVTNYILSKFIIFKKPNKEEDARKTLKK